MSFDMFTAGLTEHSDDLLSEITTHFLAWDTGISNTWNFISVASRRSLPSCIYVTDHDVQAFMTILLRKTLDLCY